MDDHATKIDEYPPCVWISLQAPGAHPRLLLRVLHDGVNQGLDLPRILSVTQNEVVGEDRLLADI